MGHRKRQGTGLAPRAPRRDLVAGLFSGRPLAGLGERRPYRPGLGSDQLAAESAARMRMANSQRTPRHATTACAPFALGAAGLVAPQALGSFAVTARHEPQGERVFPIRRGAALMQGVAAFAVVTQAGKNRLPSPAWSRGPVPLPQDASSMATRGCDIPVGTNRTGPGRPLGPFRPALNFAPPCRRGSASDGLPCETDT